MSQQRARAMARQAGQISRARMIKEYEDQQQENIDAKERSLWGRIGGSVLGGGLALLAAPFTGGSSLALAAAVGAGSRIGSEVGEHGGFKQAWEQSGGINEMLNLGTSYGGADLRRELEQRMMDDWEGYDTKQWVDAGSDAFTAFAASGGLEHVQTAMDPNFMVGGTQAPGVYGMETLPVTVTPDGVVNTGGLGARLKYIASAPATFDFSSLYNAYLARGGADYMRSY